MIDFSRAQLTHFVFHHVGNKGLGEELTLSKIPFLFKDDFVKETTLRYFLAPFKTDIYYHFKKKVDLSLKSVANVTVDLFETRQNFMKQSGVLATLLYDQTMHPKISGGYLYVCYFRDAVVDGELVDCIGLFKTEKEETYLKIVPDLADFEITADNGINIHKLDKGCLIFNTRSKEGYKISLIDNNNKVAECSLYWEEDFLNARILPNGYYHTKNFIDTARSFCEEILTEANNVKKQDQMMMLNKSTSYFKERNQFNLKDFEKEVLIEPDVIEAFQDYRKDYNKRLDLEVKDEFEVSPTAVKKNQKYMRSIVKLDKNFHIYIHAHHDYIEQGFDEEKGLKYYKLFYVNEDL